MKGERAMMSESTKKNERAKAGESTMQYERFFRKGEQ